MVDGDESGNMPIRMVGREGGYTMIIFVMIIAIMSIMMGVAVQTVEFQMRREREAELIFRGQQYVEAIRLYRLRYGRYPMRLKEIWEANPRVVRKKWKDPITDSYDWGLIFLGQEGGQVGGGGAAGGRQPGLPNQPVPTTTPGAGVGGPAGGGLPGGSGRDQGGEKVGPIVGVHSISCEESVKVYEGRTTYCEWRFVHREQRQQGGPGGRPGRPGRPVPGQPGGPGGPGGPVGTPPTGGDGGMPPPPLPTGTPYP
jgi:type II secretory pathway pseudopilin PulG